MKKIDCDIVASVMLILERHEESSRRGASTASPRLTKAAKMVALLDLMDLLGLDFDDDRARHNAISEFPELYHEKKTGAA